MPLIAEIWYGNLNSDIRKKFAGLVEKPCNRSMNNLQSLSGIKEVIGEYIGMARP